MIREWVNRMRDWVRRDELDRELAEELAHHRRMLERDVALEGVGAEQAAAAASRRLGNVTRAREDARERWSIPWLDHLYRDLRYAIRGLWRARAFTATVVITLGLGLGANAAMFDVIDGMMFRPLAYLRDPGTVQRIYWQWTDQERMVTSQSGPYTRYLDLRRETTSFSQFAAFSERRVAVGTGAEVHERRIGAVSASYFAFFNARPVLGRFFVESEDVTPRGADVVVLSYPFWQSEFGGRNVLGERLRVDNVHATIIGVAPRGFAGVNDADPPVAWIPITTYAGNTGTNDARTYYTHYSWGWMHVLARRKDNVSIERATVDATTAFQRSWTAATATEPQMPAVERARPQVAISSVRPGAGPDPSLEARTVVWVSAVAGLVLLIAAANVANLFVARAIRRQRETAVRRALGASRGRLLTQSLVESVLLALIGACAAVLLSQWASAAIRTLLAPTLATPTMALANARTIAVTFAAALLVGVTIGIVPALLSNTGDLPARLRGGARGGMVEGVRIRAALLVMQGALSTVLLIGAMLFLRSLNAVVRMPMGYDADRVLVVNHVIEGPFPGVSALRNMTSLLISTATALPDVESAAWAATVPFYSNSYTNLSVPGVDSVGSLGTFTYQVTTPDYFRTMGTRILRGRAIADGDRHGAPGVAVVSESMARVLWPAQDALGRCFRMGADTNPCLTVVGVAEDMVQRDLTGDQRYHYYIPLDQSTRTTGNYMLLKLRGDPAVIGERVRAELQRALSGGAYLTAQPLRNLVSAEQRTWRMGAALLLAFGLLALVVAAVGLHGVIGYNVSQRMHELGVRVALGARRFDIGVLVVGQSVRYVFVGVLAGMVMAVWGARWVEPLLFRQPAVDAVVYAGVALLMLTVAFAASAMPAWSATRVDPASALRAE